MEKVLIADFSSGKDRVTVRGLWQFDRGVKLKVIGINVADVNRVDFAPVIASEAVPVVVTPDEDGTFTVSIPGAATKSPYDVTAYIYVDTAEYGYTVKAVNMPVILRPEAGKTGEEEKPDPFGEAVEKVSGYAKEARDSARAAAESEKAASESATQAEKAKEASKELSEKAAESKEAAATSATSAAESESQARESATAARSAADEATESATAADESETTAAQQAQNAAQSATNAARSAESAAQSAETAKTAADAAGKSASSAQQASRSATESASTATAAAQTATTAAGNAAESATTANQSAETAGQKATAAETSASNAAESATAAEKSATAAGDSASAAKVSETAANASAVTATEQAEKINASAGQIEKNKAGVAALEEGKADKTTLAVAERKLDALWKLNQGVSYQFEKNSDAAYQKEVPTGAKLASIKQIGGKTIVWNQSIDFSSENITFKKGNRNGKADYDNENKSVRVTLLSDAVQNYHAYLTVLNKFYVEHKYFVSAFFKSNKECSIRFDAWGGSYLIEQKLQSNVERRCSAILISTENLSSMPIYPNEKDSGFAAGDWYEMRNLMVFDLTRMFGTGNEPATAKEFEAMFPEESYPYNVGELLSAGVNEIIEQGKNLYYSPEMLAVGIDSYEYIALGYSSKAIQLKPDTVYAVKFTSEKTSDIILLMNSSSNVNGNNYVDFRKLTDEKIYTTDADGKLYVGVAREKTKAEVIARLKECDIQIEESSVATAYSPYRRNTYPVLEAVRQLPGYGWSAGDVCNEIDWEGKKYIQRVGHYKFSEKTALRLMKNNSTDLYCAFFAGAENVKFNIAVNGILSKNFASKYIGGNTKAEGICCETTGFLEYKVQFEKLKCAKEDDDDTVIAAIKKYMTEIAEEAKYPLVEPIITDISDLIGNAFQEPFEVEAGGTLTFKNSHGDGFQIPVPNTEEYIVKLSEVAET